MSPVAAKPAHRQVIAAAALAAFVVAAILWAGGFSGTNGHHLVMDVPDATGLIKGQQLRGSGSAVGSIDSVQNTRGGRAARVTLRVDDDHWPLLRSSRFIAHWAGTINYNDRYITVQPGAAGGPKFSEGGRIPPANVSTPVEFDELLGSFDAPTRRGFSQMLDAGGVTLRAAAPALHRALTAAPPAVDELSHVFGDVIEDQRALDTLVRSSAGLVDAFDTAAPGVQTLVRGAAGTLATLADRSHALEVSLREAPPTFAKTHQTLDRARTTLASVRKLTTRLAPGARELRTFAAPLNRLMAEVVAVTPDARGALGALHDATPPLNSLQRKLTSLMPTLSSIGEQGAKAVQCIRPYIPELSAFFASWADFISPVDGRDHYARANVQQILAAPLNSNTQTPAEVIKNMPGTTYAFPIPPGYVYGQPVMHPECGITKDVFDPSKDPEARHYNTSDHLLGIPSPSSNERRP
ncbi:MAG: mammalian cell entry protein [Solirubrobacterales bacterium]|nr:mammalian cell entry protein [Solirubrobacterales bacterium]